MKTHPAAERYPMLEGKLYESLRASIEQNGVRNPVVIFDGQILDGRNRWKACEELGIQCPTVEHDGSDPYLYAWDLNGERRDLNADQRHLLWMYAQEDSGEWQAEQARRAEAANKARSEAAKAQHAVSNPRAGELVSGGATSCGTTKQPDRTSTAKAAASKTNRGAVERTERLARDRPDLAEKVASGKMKPGHAYRELRRDQLAGKIAALPEGQYRVIYADPPWKYGDDRSGLSGYAESAAEAHYPTMTLAEICELDVRSIAAPDSVLFLWATFPLLSEGLETAKAWGFKYKTAMIWDKQRANMGNYHDARAELLIIATRGSCVPEGEGRPAQVQSIARGKHSAKPEEFRTLISRMYPNGPRVELFHRGVRPEGWIVWGNEADG